MVGVLSLDLDGLKMYAGVLKMYTAVLKMYAGGLKMYRCPNFVKTKIIKKVCSYLVKQHSFLYYICKHISPKYLNIPLFINIYYK